ncbi:MAG TPA: hypothetical protein VN256_12470 [Pyrinomonadaceae bacterium]|nr:hypothetical protein [Pyrinomonadaceae bacterium]
MSKTSKPGVDWTKLCAALALMCSLFGFSTAAFAQNKSIYTSLAADKCKTIAVDNGMPGNYSTRCDGAGGYKLEVYLDDERNSIGVVLPSNETVGLDFWNHFGNFSALGEKAEWRMKGQKPVALIVRLNVSDQGDGKPPTSYLIVSKISSNKPCVTDIVKPGKNQNAQARRLADAASTKPCK